MPMLETSGPLMFDPAPSDCEPPAPVASLGDIKFVKSKTRGSGVLSQSFAEYCTKFVHPVNAIRIDRVTTNNFLIIKSLDAPPRAGYSSRLLDAIAYSISMSQTRHRPEAVEGSAVTGGCEY